MKLCCISSTKYVEDPIPIIPDKFTGVETMCHSMIGINTPAYKKYVELEYKSKVDFDNLTSSEAEFLINNADPQGLQYGGWDWIYKLKTKVKKNNRKSFD